MKQLTTHSKLFRRSTFAVIVCMGIGEVLVAQTSRPGGASHLKPAVASSGRHRIITLEQVQQQAAPQKNNPAARLAELQIEVAKQHRLATQSDFFPKLSSTFLNLHYNKFMGQTVQVVRPIAGTTATLAVPLLAKDETMVAVNAVQPITPLFKLRQAVNIARADENIAKAKAGIPVSETTSNVEKNYFELLVAQRQLAFAKANAGKMENRLLKNISMVDVAANHENLLKTSEALAIATSRVKELTSSLNEMFGWPEDTELELVPPETSFEDVSLKEATENAMAANPEVVEAEQTVLKARAATSLAKLDYVPDVAVIGGYAYQNAVPLLPKDFSYIGVLGSYTLFDFGKRERTTKERNAQLEMAQTALELTRAKVATGVKSNYFELERLRQLCELTRRLVSAIQLQKASYQGDELELVAARAKLEAEEFQSDLDYRQALGHLKILTGSDSSSQWQRMSISEAGQLQH